MPCIEDPIGHVTCKKRFSLSHKPSKDLSQPFLQFNHQKKREIILEEHVNLLICTNWPISWAYNYLYREGSTSLGKPFDQASET